MGAFCMTQIQQGPRQKATGKTHDKWPSQPVYGRRADASKWILKMRLQVVQWSQLAKADFEVPKRAVL
jgi:hypothetical protein